MSENIITLESVTKQYGSNLVIDSVSHSFRKGEAVAFVGHNGCGKSTMLKILGGLAKVSSGKVRCPERVRFSYVPEKIVGIDIKMNAYLKYIAKMEGVAFEKVDLLIRDFFLDDMRSIRMKNMSKGSLQKVGVIQALMAPHDVILLDEPLSGQDVQSQEVFVSKMNELKSQGKTIFISCHEKKLIDELSDKVYAIESGRLKDMEDVEESVFRIYVRRNDGLKKWKEMVLHGNRYMVKVKETDMKKTVTKMFDEGWELVGIEECY